MTNKILQEHIKLLIKNSFSKGYETAQAMAIVPDNTVPDSAADIFLDEIMKDEALAATIRSL